MTHAPAPPSPATPGPPPRVPRAYRKAPPEAWARIQAAYVAGTPAPVLAEQYGVTAWAIRKRASTGGWTRREHARRTLALDLPVLGGDRRPPEVAAAKAAADAQAAAALAAARAQAAAAEAEAAREESDPLDAARTLLRRGAAAAVAGRLAQAGAAVRLADGLARAARLLGLAPDAGDDWDEDGEEDEDGEALSPEALAELRADVERRYARFDRPPPAEAPPLPPLAGASDEAPATPAPQPPAPATRASAPPESVTPQVEPTEPAEPAPAAAPRSPWPAWIEAQLRAPAPRGISAPYTGGITRRA